MKKCKSDFCILTDAPPEVWRGVKINTSYRTALRFFQVLSEDIPERKKADKIIRLFFTELPYNQNDIWDFIMYFMRCGKESNEESDDEKTFDFFIDASRIYSAFYQTYNIDLLTNDLHWWVFMALFESIPDNTKFMQIIEIRTKKTSKHDSAEYKRQLSKLKEIYSLEDDYQAESLGSFLSSW